MIDRPKHRHCVWVGALAMVSVMLSTSSVSAATRQARERAARKACLAGEATKGVEILAELFVETQNTTYIFNQGRCFEQNQMYKDAQARFEEYLRSPGVDSKPEDKASAEKHIVVCKEKMAEERAILSPQPVATPVATPVNPPPSLPVALPEATPTVETKPNPAPEQGERRTGLLTAGIITSVLGVGGIVTGVIFNLKANNTVNEMQTKTGAYSETKENDQKGYRTLAWIGYGAGAACAVAGAIMIGFGASRSSPSSGADVALLPAVGAGQLGAVFTGSF